MTPDPARVTPIPTEPITKPQPDAAGTLQFHPDTASDGPSPPREPGRVRVGEPLGRYMITAVLGQGGMGTVLRGHDAGIERDVAVKVLANYLADDPTSLARFTAEARSAGRINHPNVVAIYEIGQDGPTHYLALEFVPGGSLSERIEAGKPMPPLEATRAMIDACKGVGAAHAAGVIHRDIKPANFMLTSDGTVKVADFGLAKSTEAGRHLTQTGTAVGTPFYMSPEQCEARPVDHRTDIYSLGATYYSLLTGRYPFHISATVPQLMYQHCHGPIPDPRADNPNVPEACARIVAKAMAKAPADRYQSAAAMLADLQAVAATLSGQAAITLPSESGLVRPLAASATAVSRTGRRRSPALVAGVALIAIIGVGLSIWRPWASRERERPEGAFVFAANAEPVKVGILHSLTGTMANSTLVVVDATRFAIDEVNAAGGVLGRPVVPVIADGRSDWRIFASEAERLITEEKVCTIMGCWTSAGRKMVKPVVEAHDHLLIYPVQYEGLETSPCIFYLGAAPNQQILPAVDWAVNTLHKKRFFLVGSDYVYPRAANEIIKDHLKRIGGEIADEKYIPLETDNIAENVAAVIAAIVKAKPDMILNTINGDANINFFRELRAAGVKQTDTPTLSFSVGEEDLRSLRPADLAGDYTAWTYYESVDTPENREFVRRYHEKYPLRVVNDPMETAYVGVKLWAQAVNEAQSLEPRKIRRALLNQRIKAPDGEVRIDADNQHSFLTPRIAQIQADRRFKVIWEAPAQVKPEPYPNSRTAEAWRVFLQDLYSHWGNRWAAPEGGRVAP
jgi:urea transport system substrate-binding protein